MKQTCKNQKNPQKNVAHIIVLMTIDTHASRNTLTGFQKHYQILLQSLHRLHEQPSHLRKVDTTVEFNDPTKQFMSTVVSLRFKVPGHLPAQLAVLLFALELQCSKLDFLFYVNNRTHSYQHQTRIFCFLTEFFSLRSLELHLMSFKNKLKDSVFGTSYLVPILLSFASGTTCPLIL